MVESSDDDEPLSASLRRTSTFKETGLLQPKTSRSEKVTVDSFLFSRASLMVLAQKVARTVSNKIPRRASGVDISSRKVTLFSVVRACCKLIQIIE